jgi:nucleoside-diphosphate-sugar epimerase
MRVVVIGGTQFMGREIVRRLVENGHDVSVLHRADRHDLGPDVQNLQADRADLTRISDLLARGRFEAVFDLAYDWQHGTTADQVEALARGCGDRLQRYVFMSSVAAYGPGLDHRESDPLAPDDVPNPYAQHKASAERRLFSLHATSGLPVTTIRPVFVHGPRQPFYREQFFWDRLLDGRPIVLPDGGLAPMQWVFVADVAEACVRAMARPEAVGQAFNLGHVEPMTQRSFVEALARVVGREPELVSIPRATITSMGGQLAGGNLYFGEFLDLPPHTVNADKARQLLGIVPTPLEAALRLGFEWYTTQPRRPSDYVLEDRLLGAV